MEKWPYPKALTNAELVKEIEMFKEDAYLENINRHFQDAGAFDKGNAAEQVKNIIDNYIEKS